MNLDTIQQELENATPYQLERLCSMLQTMRDDPQRIMKAMSRLRVGQQVAYWDHRENRNIEGVVSEVKQTRVVLQVEGRGVAVPISLIADTEPLTLTESAGVSRHNAKVGQTVSFVHQGREIVGEIIKLNQKTAKVSVPIPECERKAHWQSTEMWNVTYDLLTPLLDGEASQHDSTVLLGEVV